MDSENLENNDENEYVSLDRIKREGAQYNILFGKRSNGKTYAVLKEILRLTAEGVQGAIIRRTEEDFRGARGRAIWDALIEDGAVKEYTGGKWTGIVYFSGAWYFSKTTEDKKGNTKTIKASDPFCYKFALNTMEHDKSTSYPKIGIILFDEFIARGFYIPDEFVLFQNTISTIVRNRSDVVIYMLGNTVNKYSPYFTEMGLTHIQNMKPGDLDVYTYGKSDLKVAVEFTDTRKERPSDIYFAFDNPKLKMITDGLWEIDIYPHLPAKYSPKDIVFYFVIQFNGENFQGEVITKDGSIFAYIHKKTSPIKDDDFTIGPQWSNNPRHCHNILRPEYKWSQRISDLFRHDRVFYQDNTIGDTVNNYILWCKQN